MRVGYVIARFPLPSETFVSREIASLMEAGVDVRIYAFSPPGERDWSLITPEARRLSQRTRYIGHRQAMGALATRDGAAALRLILGEARDAVAGRKRLVLAGRAAALARAAKADGVTQLYAHWPYATIASALAAQIAKLPYSVSIHAHEVAHEKAHFPYCFQSLRFAAFCNRAAMDHLLQSLPNAARAKSHLVYHGVDISAFAAAPPAAPPPPLKILSAGRLTPTKGFDRLVRACAHAQAQGVDIELTILGRGDQAPALKALAEELGFAGRLHLPGWVPHDAVHGYLSDHHIFALLADTNFNDGLPNVAMEAMAVGRPVILSPLPAAAEAVEHGQNGYILRSPDDYDGFVAIAAALAKEPGLVSEAGLKARQTVCERYDEKMHITHLLNLMREHGHAG